MNKKMNKIKIFKNKIRLKTKIKVYKIVRGQLSVTTLLYKLCLTQGATK